VAFGIDGLKEAIAHGTTGILVKPGDVETLASEILALLADPNRAARLGDRARERVLAGDPWAAHVNAYESLYERVGGPARSGSVG
jgi:starch synthase